MHNKFNFCYGRVQTKYLRSTKICLRCHIIYTFILVILGSFFVDKSEHGCSGCNSNNCCINLSWSESIKCYYSKQKVDYAHNMI